MNERWEHFFDEKHEIDYPQLTMFQLVKKNAAKYPDEVAYEFMGKKTTYREFFGKVELTAKALTSIGIREGDAVTICMPNCPQAIDTFYAVNRIGAIANMIHPLSAESEITFYLNISNSKVILTLDQFYEKIVAAREGCDHTVIILMAQVSDELPKYLELPYKIKNFGKYSNLPNQAYSLTWKEFLHYGSKFPLPLPKIEFRVDRTAVILYSGGTTGTTKGIMLSDLNFNACALQSSVAMEVPYEKGQKILAVMPLFHGFGLGIGIHTCLVKGICCDLIPQFTVKTYAQMLVKKKPNFIAGVPTLYEALLRTKGLELANLSFLKGMYSGGDSLSVELKTKVDKFLKDHGAKIQVREGYGTTECVTASCLTPSNDYRPGSIGLPYPDTTYIICEPGTTKQVPVGEEGEICLNGPSVMLGYLKNEEETRQTIQKHEDGRYYLHTGDLGAMDADGFVYFKQRIKRMIISSGYNVYPSQIENVIDANPKVLYSCVIGVKDSYKMQKVKAFVVLKPNVVPDDSVKEEILTYCRKHIAKYAMPYDIEFRDELPKTLVGKVAYRVLEEEENAKIDQENAKAASEKKPEKKTEKK
ncbi:MAG: AMP-binding protein [Erysipelotrichaceae bacterium]|nr:AMP-binding protein [Erysipelotrichaceae bacterium]MBQ1303723.1 AMP-binding protein [Erysipelotrichaceae bacterium]MBQ2685062.1 AMP-binding protein [Erysipelotrichaceae bacterium]